MIKKVSERSQIQPFAFANCVSRSYNVHSFFEMGQQMAKQNLSSMTVDALLKLRNDIGAVLSRKADDLKTELKAIDADYANVGRIALYGKKSLNGRKKISKAAVKYRHPKTKETWAGRGAMASWLKA